MPSGDAVSAFWRPLKKSLTNSGVTRKQICALLNLSESAVSELLSGKRAKAPDWDVVKVLVEAAAGADERTNQLAYWKRRLTELENELERATDNGARRPAGHDDLKPSRVSCLICDDAYQTERFWPEKHGFDHAMRILAGARSELISEIESLIAASIDSPGAMAAFRDEFAEATQKLLDGLGARVRQACRPHRLWFLHAGHTVLIAQALVAAGTALTDRESEAGFELPIGTLLETLTPGETFYVPDTILLTDVPYADRHDWVVAYYCEIFESLSGVDVPGPGAAERMAVRTASEYQSRLRRLASECPELFLWAGMQDDPDAEGVMDRWPDGEVERRLKESYRRLQTQKRGLEGLETLLKGLAWDLPAGGWPLTLSEIYRSDLRRPITPIGELEGEASGMRVPLLADGYVNPAFRSAVYRSGETPHIDSWWGDKSLRAEIQGFLAGFLTNAPTVDKPLIILGDPGTGKSVLTRLLVARLPPEDYLPIRIELRDVRSDVDPVKQVTEALRAVTLDDHITWAAVYDSVTTVLPVLVFDGFDELLQAGGADHWGYLEQIASFQASCAARGRPVAVIVTSRTVVANQAQIPDGSMVVRLEPFDAERVERWVGQWNRINRVHFRRRAIEPLRADVIMQRYRHLAEQPLLLMMLALYLSISATEQAGSDDGISRVQLYERLFSLFIRRQILKLEPNTRPKELEERKEREFDHLAVIAFAMFNRVRQGVTAEEADHDLDLLLPEESAPAERSTLLFGRFFFIHEAKATIRGGEERRWYEFLHSTFSEFLIARKIAGMLADGTPKSLAGLFDVLSHRPLSDRTQILEDFRDLRPPFAALPELFKGSLHHRQDHVELGGPAPAPPATYRYACYSANLLLLALAEDRPRLFSEVIDDATDPVQGWRSHAMLWSSQFLPSSWDAFTRTVSAVPSWTAQEASPRARDIEVRLDYHRTLLMGHNALWTHSLPPDTVGAVFRAGDPAGGEGWPATPNEGFLAEAALRRSRFLHDPDIEPLVEPGLALVPNHKFLLDVIRGGRFGQSTSAAHDLISLILDFPGPTSEFPVRYDSCIKALDRCHDVEVQDYFIVILTHLLGRHREDLPAEAVTAILGELSRRQRFDASWLILLATVVEGLGRIAPGDVVGLVETLLEARHRARTFPSADSWPLEPRATASAAKPTEVLLTEAADQVLREESDGHTRRQAMLVLLRKAIDLRLEGWCDRYAERIFEDQELSRQAAATLTRLQWTYLRQIVISQTADRRTGSWLLDDSHEPEDASAD